MNKYKVYLGIKSFSIFIVVLAIGTVILLQLAFLVFLFVYVASSFVESDFFMETWKFLQAMPVESPKVQIQEPLDLPKESNPKVSHLGEDIAVMGAIASLTAITLGIIFNFWGVDPTVYVDPSEIDLLLLRSKLMRLESKQMMLELLKSLDDFKELLKKNK